MVGKPPSRGPSHIAGRTARELSDCGTHESDAVRTAAEGVYHGACTSRPPPASAGIGLLRLPPLDGAWHGLPSACFFGFTGLRDSNPQDNVACHAEARRISTLCACGPCGMTSFQSLFIVRLQYKKMVTLSIAR